MTQDPGRCLDVRPDSTFLESSLVPARLTPPSPQSADQHRPIDLAALGAVSAEIEHAAVDLAAGRWREAFDRIRIVLADNPDHARALGMLGQIAVFVNQAAAGLAPLQRAVALDPRLEHRVWLALCLAKLGCAEDAVSVISAGIKNMPPTANAHFAIGMVFYALGQYEDAARFYGNCIALDAGRADAWHRYARALQASGKTGSAIDAYTEAIRNCGTRADYYADLSGALSDLGRFEEARAAGKTAVELDPGCIVAHNNLGHALQSLNRSAEAVPVYETAIEACDTYTKAQLGLGLALLKCGDFERGWRQYEWRWQDGQTPRPDLDVPVWRGEDIRGRTILLHAEQGLGDTLQFVRFAPLVASRGGHVVLEVPASLVRLMRWVDGVSEVITCGDPIPPIDLHCPMASLPLAFQLRLDTIPASPYLRVPTGDCVPPVEAPHLCFRAWGEMTESFPRTHLLPPVMVGAGRPSVVRGAELAQSVDGRPSPTMTAWGKSEAHTGPIEGPDLVIGLVWAGDPRQSQPSLNLIDRRRSTTLETLAPLLDIDRVRFLGFQFGEARRQLAASNRPIVDAMEGVADFADTAARLAGVDLLISVDTSMVHLAGGLGMPVWMLSRFDGCWRWLERRDDSPWYPSMRIFRQPSPGDWSSVVGEAAAVLRKVVTGS